MDKLQITIGYLYYDLMNLYGDKGNITILTNLLKENDIDVNIKYLSIEDDFNLNECDIVFIGGGQDKEQELVSKDLIKKSDNLGKYIHDGGCGLFICGGYQLLGKYYVAAYDTKIECANVLDIYTDKGTQRFLNDIVIDSSFFNTKIVGYENHSGRTFIGDYSPLGNVVSGNGNNGIDGTEGLIYKNTICTYIHGCLLSKNIEIAKFLCEKAIFNRYEQEIEIKSKNEDIYLKAKELFIQNKISTNK